MSVADTSSNAAAPLRAAAPLDAVSPVIMFRAAGDPLSRAKESQRGLRVGFTSSLSRGPLRSLLRQAQSRPGGPRLSFLEGGRSDVLLAARRGEVDVGFVCGPEDWTRLRSEELWRDRLVVALAEDHPLARENAVRREDLQRETFLAPGASTDRHGQLALIERAIGGAPSGFVCVEAERESVFHLVGLGFGVALASSSALGTVYPGVVYRPIASPWTSLPFYAVWRSSSDNPELGSFLTAAREAARHWAAPQ